MSRPRPFRPRRRGFTLIEMLTVIGLLVLLSSMALFTMWGANEEAKAERTRSSIRQIDLLIRLKWDSYLTRRVSVSDTINASLSNRERRVMGRVAAIRELQRMELPDRITDISDFGPNNGAYVLKSPPAVWRAYRRRALRELGDAGGGIPDWTNWTTAHQASECLYLILSHLSDGESNGLDLLKPSEIDDTDEDGMNEVLDAWGRPIDFIRWAPGYLANPIEAWHPVGAPAGMIAVATSQTAPYFLGVASPVKVDAPAPDPFDPLQIDPRWRDTDDASLPERVNDPFNLVPLIFSGGPDRVKDIQFYASGNQLNSAISADMTAAETEAGMSLPNNLFRNDPFRNFTGGASSYFLGTPGPAAADNITNHYVEAQ